MKIRIALIGMYHAFEHHQYKFEDRITYASLKNAYFEVGEFCFHYARRREDVQGLHLQSRLLVGVVQTEETLDTFDYALTRMRPLPPKIMPPMCSQCGALITACSCGPTHGILKAEWNSR